MAYELRDNSGSFFDNDRKEKETHPDFNGSAMIDGVQYWVSVWRKDGRGGTFYSMSFKPKEARAAEIRREAESRPEPAQQGGGNFSRDLDDEIPFAPEWR